MIANSELQVTLANFENIFFECTSWSELWIYFSRTSNFELLWEERKVLEKLFRNYNKFLKNKLNNWKNITVEKL